MSTNSSRDEAQKCVDGYSILKANFHTHYAQSHLGDPWPVIDYHRREGYDAIALTEHGHQTDTGVEREAARACRRRFGDSFFVIPGKENTVAGDPDGRFFGNHLRAQTVGAG